MSFEQEREEFRLAAVHAEIVRRLQTRTDEEAELALLSLGFKKSVYFDERKAEIA